MRAEARLLGGRAPARRSGRSGLGLLALASAISAWWSWRGSELIEPTRLPHWPEQPTDRVLPLPDLSRPQQSAPAPMVLVQIRGDLVRHRAQVRIGARTVTVGDLREVLVPAGRVTVRWREHERAPWRRGGEWRLEPGTAVMAFVAEDGLRLRMLP
jgi:hypothetical protein